MRTQGPSGGGPVRSRAQPPTVGAALSRMGEKLIPTLGATDAGAACLAAERDPRLGRGSAKRSLGPRAPIPPAGSREAQRTAAYRFSRARKTDPIALVA